MIITFALITCLQYLKYKNTDFIFEKTKQIVNIVNAVIICGDEDIEWLIIIEIALLIVQYCGCASWRHYMDWKEWDCHFEWQQPDAQSFPGISSQGADEVVAQW